MLRAVNYAQLLIPDFSLILLGAKEDQVESVSLGEEKPKNAGHDEASWSENRRADILYKAADGRGEF